MELSQRDFLLGVGLGSVFPARHFYKTARLWPFRIAVITAWPCVGVAIMQTVIGNTVEQNVSPCLSSACAMPPMRTNGRLPVLYCISVLPDKSRQLHAKANAPSMCGPKDASPALQVRDLTLQQAEELDKARQNNAAFVERMKHLAGK